MSAGERALLEAFVVDSHDLEHLESLLDVADLRGAVVRREWQCINILVHDAENRLVCTVENKIGAREHSDQLRRC